MKLCIVVVLGLILSTSSVALLSVNAAGYSGRPYLGSPVSLPGVVEAANYDLGGQGVAYNVLSSVNQGGAYRTTEAVSLEQTGDSTTSASGDAYDTGWINPTEWENYTVTSAGGPFTASIRVAANGPGGTFHLECPTGTKITGELTIPNTGGWQTYTTLTAPVTLPAGNQVLRIVWDTAPSGFVGNFHWIQISSSSNVGSVNAGGYSGRPYLGSPVSLPGVVEAANYDLGGQGVAYNVLSTVNQGGAYRTSEAVSLEQTGDSTTPASGDAFDMGWINPTEWENYTVTSAGGPFTASIRVAANGPGGTFHLECPTGTKITGELTIPNTGGWQTYTTLTAPVTLPAGNQVLRIVWDTAPSGFVGNFHWIQISSSSNVGQAPANAGGYSGRPYLGSPVSLPGVVEAANYDLGGQGVAYNVLNTVNQGGAYRTTEAVSLEQTGDSTTSASGDAYDMGWINPTEWENYTVTSVGGPFTASIRVAANGSGGTFHLECPTGTKITGELTIPNTGGWQTYTTLTAPVRLPAGNQVLRIVWDTAPSGFVGNFHWIQISSSSNVGQAPANAGGYSGRPYLGSPVSLPGVVEAANYDLGGQGVAYNVLNTVNQGGAYRTTEAVSLEQTGDSTTSASGDAYDMGWINPTEWENYTVTSAGGPFTASIRVAADGSGGTFHLECPTGTKITGELTIPDTGGWQTYTTLTAPVTLPAGNQVLRIVWDTAPSGFVGNFHWIQLGSSSGGTDTSWVISPATDSISGPYPMTIQYHAVGNMTGRDVTGSVTWTSSNPPLVSIGAGGLALIVDPGSAGVANVTITATK